MTEGWYIVIGLQSESDLNNFNKRLLPDGGHVPDFSCFEDIEYKMKIVGPVYMDPEDINFDVDSLKEDLMDEKEYDYFVFWRMQEMKIKKIGLFDVTEQVGLDRK